MPRPLFPLLILLAALLGCDSAPDDPVLRIGVIAEDGEMVRHGSRLSWPAQAYRAATAQGLVALDQEGRIVPALAERWLVTDDGLSYIFRLRDTRWAGGTPVTAQDARRSLENAIRALAGTSLGLDLAPVAEVRAMTGRVIEITLDTPQPTLLQLLAQPELGLVLPGAGGGADGGTGPMVPIAPTDWPVPIEAEGTLLAPLPPEARGLPGDEDWREDVRPLDLVPLSAARGVEAFRRGALDLVIGGTLADLPLATAAPLSRGNLRVDAALGLFGLRVLRTEGPLATPGLREAVAMAIDRDTLLEPLALDGWATTTRLVPPGEANPGGAAGERWPGTTIEQRRAEARRRLAPVGPATLLVALPEGPGAALLLRRLSADLEPMGIALRRAGEGERADLALVDRLARFPGARWYLGQMNCDLDLGACSPEADTLVAEALAAPDPAAREALLAEALATLEAEFAYIPLGAPIRWSLARADLPGFAENRWASHPLFALAFRAE